MNGKIIAAAPDSRLPALDGLRAIAILLVLQGHHLSAVPIPWVRWLTEKGWVGVDLFFVLSGFLIGGILLDNRPAANYFRVFYLRRFFRIVPLYALLVLPGLLALGCGLQWLFSGHSLAGQSLAGMWLCVFFVQNFSACFHLFIPGYLGPTWSVAVEEQFYLLLPPLVRRCSPGKLLKVLILAIVLAPLARGAILLWMGPDAGLACYFLLPCRWDSLLLGVVAAIGYRSVPFRQWLAGRRGRLQSAWWLLLAASAALLLSSEDHLDARLAFLGYTIIDAWFACTLLLAVMNTGGSLNRFLSRPGFKPIAMVSYGLYLLQSPMMALGETVAGCLHLQHAKISWTETGIALVSLAATGIAAAVSWKFFESRMIRFGHRQKYQFH